MSEVGLTGGCQCGAVRYELDKVPERPCICYCRMCQKASGNIFGTFAGVETSHFKVTRGEIAWWQSSHTGRRGFCRDCGTPLAWGSAEGEDWIAPTIGSFDEPERIKPVFAYDIEAKVPWTDEAIALKPIKLGEGRTSSWPIAKVQQTTRQHPDHDTAEWPPTSNL
ncbi:MAG: GFA family protein [Devosia sp.]